MCDEELNLVVRGLPVKEMCQIMYIYIHLFIFYHESELACGGAGIGRLRVKSGNNSLVLVDDGRHMRTVDRICAAKLEVFSVVAAMVARKQGRSQDVMNVEHESGCNPCAKVSIIQRC